MNTRRCLIENNKPFNLHSNWQQMVNSLRCVLFQYTDCGYESWLHWGLFIACCWHLVNSPWLTFAVQTPHLVSVPNKWKHAHALIPHAVDTLCGHISEAANIIRSVFAVCNILLWHEWWIQAETDYDWCRTNWNFQIARKVYAEGGGRHGRFINEHRIHFKMNLIWCTWALCLIAWTGTDWFNRHDD